MKLLTKVKQTCSLTSSNKLIAKGFAIFDSAVTVLDEGIELANQEASKEIEAMREREIKYLEENDKSMDKVQELQEDISRATSLKSKLTQFMEV